MRFKIVEKEVEGKGPLQEVRLRMGYQGDLDLQAKVNGQWRLLLWITEEGEITIATPISSLPLGFSFS